MKAKFTPSVPIAASEITPEHYYINRRSFLKAMGFVGAGAILAACGIGSPANSSQQTEPVIIPTSAGAPPTSGNVDELGSALTPLDTITHYNNYYEFTTDKEGVADMSRSFRTQPWTVQVGGMVRNPKTYDVNDLIKKYNPEERIYRLRCVEAWSMVIPWQGFELAALLKDVEPLSEAKYVHFETIHDASQMPGQYDPLYPWPYSEGLRIDEAMNSLTLLATGIYGKPLPPQDGAPIRLVVPWKYGFKSIKAIIKIELTDKQPQTMWNTIAPDEYGFYANVNPAVDHPRWSQASERRIGENGRRRTLPFNGYAAEVAALYQGLDLRQNY
jgi:methionine sulfoxide reductase catalytic subunit